MNIKNSLCMIGVKPSTSKTLTSKELSLLLNGKKIAAIKEVKYRLGLKLKEAKEIVDKAQLKI